MSIYPDRKNGKLTGKYRVEVQLRGVRLKDRTATYEEAIIREKELRAALASGEAKGTPRKRTFISDTAKSLMTVRSSINKAKGLLWAGQSTEAESLRKLERIAFIIGDDTPIDSVDANAVDKIIVSLKDGGASDATVNRYLSAVSAFLKFCKKRDIRKTEVPEFDWRDEDEGRIRWLTYEEEKELLDLLPQPFSTVVYIAIRTGMRASELLSLKPDQIEPGWAHLWKTKNGGSRSVPLSKDLYGILEPLVTEGRLPDYWKLRYEWDQARKPMNLSDDPTFVFHSCRHTYATRAVQAGVNIRVLQKLMGHKSIQTTLRYAHVDDKTLKDAALTALDFHEERGGRKVGDMPQNRPLSSRKVVNKTAEIRHSQGKLSAATGLQIRLRRFDSGSGLHLFQSVTANDD